MNQEYKSKELESETLEKNETYERNEQQIQAMIEIKEEIIKLRGQVQLRFFSRAADNLGHSQRILILQADIKQLILEKGSLQGLGRDEGTNREAYLFKFDTACCI